MKRFSVLLILIITLVCVPAYAALNLELTQGINAALPIAIIPFANEQANADGDQSITQIVTHDLQNSGQFRVEAPGMMTEQPTTLDQVDNEYWRKKNVDDVLIGQVKSLGNQQYRVSFQLVSTVDAAAKTTLLNLSFDAPRSGLRALAHHMSDLIYQQLTGARGVFSTKVAYVLVQRRRHQPTKYTLEVSDIDGFNPRALLVSTQPLMSPTWSPDGNSLAYVSFEGHQASIYLQNIATAQRQKLTQYPGINGAPAFSPDGKQLALVLTLTGNPKIYTYSLDTGKLMRITNGYSIDTEPAWAKDGKSLLFTSNRGGSPQIYRYYFDAGKIDRVTFDGNYNARASFMPNDQGIIMMHRETGLFGIARENLDSGEVDVLAQTGSDESPSLSPNGKMVIYATQYGGRGVLALVSTDGRVKLRLPAREGSVREPAWSPYLN
ncbi:MAG: Tol-Pal system beta propeller repeat protein TolB [Coxiellaceae bacterium]|nr:Tol-Pal system beta propeller repeat protein TolB [Coxiellaceae bacterium]